MTREKVIGVYVLEHTASGRKYVGKSVDVFYRFKQHRTGTSSGYLKKALAKYGADAFTWRLLEVCETEAYALERERFWIAELNTRAPNGFNLTAGGDGVSGFTHSDASRKKMRKPKSEETRRRMSASATGRRMSDAAKAKVSASRRGQYVGRRLSEETRQKIAESMRKLRAAQREGSSNG